MDMIRVYKIIFWCSVVNFSVISRCAESPREESADFLRQAILQRRVALREEKEESPAAMFREWNEATEPVVQSPPRVITLPPPEQAAYIKPQYVPEPQKTAPVPSPEVNVPVSMQPISTGYSEVGEENEDWPTGSIILDTNPVIKEGPPSPELVTEMQQGLSAWTRGESPTTAKKEPKPAPGKLPPLPSESPVARFIANQTGQFVPSKQKSSQQPQPSQAIRERAATLRQKLGGETPPIAGLSLLTPEEAIAPSNIPVASPPPPMPQTEHLVPIPPVVPISQPPVILQPATPVVIPIAAPAMGGLLPPPPPPPVVQPQSKTQQLSPTSLEQALAQAQLRKVTAPEEQKQSASSASKKPQTMQEELAARLVSRRGSEPQELSQPQIAPQPLPVTIPEARPIPGSVGGPPPPPPPPPVSKTPKKIIIPKQTQQPSVQSQRPAQPSKNMAELLRGSSFFQRQAGQQGQPSIPQILEKPKPIQEPIISQQSSEEQTSVSEEEILPEPISSVPIILSQQQKQKDAIESIQNKFEILKDELAQNKQLSGVDAQFETLLKEINDIDGILQEQISKQTNTADLTQAVQSIRELKNAITLRQEQYDVETRLGYENLDISDDSLLQAAIEQFKRDFQRSRRIELGKISIINVLLTQIASYVPKTSIIFDEHLQFTFNGFGPFPSELGHGFVVNGSLEYKGRAITAYIMVARPLNANALGISFRLVMPPSWKVSNDYPQWKKLDDLSLLSPTFIFSTFDKYFDPEFKEQIKRGLTLVSRVNLTGPLEPFNNFYRLIDPYLRDKTRSVTFIAHLAPDIFKSDIAVRIPCRMGIDFEEEYRMGRSTLQPLLFSSIGTSDLELKYDFAETKFSASAGVLIGLLSQTQPLEFRGGMVIGIGTYALYGSMDGIIQNLFGFKGISLGQLGAEIEFGPLALVGPISGIGFRGRTIFGTRHPVSIDVAGKVSSANLGMPSRTIPISTPTFVLSGRINQLPLMTFIELLNVIIGKPIPEDKLPMIMFHDMELTIIPNTTSIAGKSYGRGFRANGGFNIHNFLGGGELMISDLEKRIAGQGYLSPIDLPFIKLKGKSESGGPIIQFDIGLFKQEILASVELFIPPLFNFGQIIDCLFNRDGLFSFFKTQFTEHISGQFTLNIPFTSFEELLIEAELKVDLNALKTELDTARLEMKKNIETEKQALEQRIININEQMAQTKRLCQQSWTRNFSKCLSTANKWLQQQLVMAQNMLKSVERVVKSGYYKTMSTIVDTARALEIKHAYAGITGKDLKAFKAPRFTIVVNFDLPGFREERSLNIQFDFKNPRQSIKDIAREIANFIKGREPQEVVAIPTTQLTKEELQLILQLEESGVILSESDQTELLEPEVESSETVEDVSEAAAVA